jgi:long-chain fatty acid transport protein
MISTLRSFVLAAAFTTLVTAPALATDGYFLPGYGVKQQGQGGAGIALPQDGLASATNPAGLVFVGDRLDIGATLFRPIRGGTIVGNQLPPGYPNANGDYDANDQTLFPIPELGYKRSLGGRRAALGLAVFGNGGLNTSYVTPIPLLGSSKAGVDLQQLFVAPTLAFNVAPHQAVGVALNIGYQRFKAEGLQNFASAGFSSAPASVTGQGYASSFGAGVRVGWLAELTPLVKVGATLQTKTYARPFDKYAGLFAEQGSFDIPANFGAGIAVNVHPKVTVLVDGERILYGQVKAIANSGAAQALLGSSGGPGFGWQDVTVEKLGVDVAVSPRLTLRGGYNHSDVPFPSTETFFNLLAPAVVQHHATVGATWRLAAGQEISVAWVHAFANTVNGTASIAPSAGGGNANLRMYQDSLGVSLGWRRD